MAAAFVFCSHSGLSQRRMRAGGRPSLWRSRTRILRQCRWTNPRQAACVLFKEMLKLRRGEQRHCGNRAASKHAAPPGGEIGLFGLCQLNINTWSHDYVFPSDRWMGQTLCHGECGLRGGDSIRREKFPPSGVKMKVKGGNNSARAGVMKVSCAGYPQDQAA